MLALCVWLFTVWLWLPFSLVPGRVYPLTALLSPTEPPAVVLPVLVIAPLLFRAAPVDVGPPLPVLPPPPLSVVSFAPSALRETPVVNSPLDPVDPSAAPVALMGVPSLSSAYPVFGAAAPSSIGDPLVMTCDTVRNGTVTLALPPDRLVRSLAPPALLVCVLAPPALVVVTVEPPAAAPVS